MASDIDSPFDKTVALSRVRGDVSLLKELLGVFSLECQQLMAEIRRAIDERDPGRLRRAAHTLKGAVGVFGAAAVFDIAMKLESMGRDGNLAGAKETYAILENAISRLKPALTEFANDQLKGAQTDD